MRITFFYSFLELQPKQQKQNTAQKILSQKLFSKHGGKVCRLNTTKKRTYDDYIPSPHNSLRSTYTFMYALLRHILMDCFINIIFVSIYLLFNLRIFSILSFFFFFLFSLSVVFVSSASSGSLLLCVHLSPKGCATFSI